MKATIDEVGCLRIAPETPLEAYALQRWSEDFKPLPNPDGGRSALAIVYKPQDYEHNTPGA